MRLGHCVTFEAVLEPDKQTKLIARECSVVQIGSKERSENRLFFCAYFCLFNLFDILFFFKGNGVQHTKKSKFSQKNITR